MKFIFVFIILFGSLTFGQIGIELEHTYFSPEGSSWGTEESFRQALKISEKDLPQLFKTPLQRPFPKVVKLGENISASTERKKPNIYMNNTIFLYRELNICLDQRIPSSATGFQEAMELFLQHVSGVNAKTRPLNIHILPIDVRNIDQEDHSKCDILAFQGIENGFPFSRLKNPSPINKKTGRFELPELILGLYYRFSETSLPVLVFNPQIQMTFDGNDDRYMKILSNGKILVDGRILLFHEIGHVLGFAHIYENSYLEPVESLSIMGVDNSQRKEDDIDLRFSSDLQVWKYWNLNQTSMYRALLWKWAQGEELSRGEINFNNPNSSLNFCVMPGEDVSLRFMRFRLSNDSKTYEDINTLKDIALSNPTARTDSKNKEWDYYLSSKAYLGIAEFDSYKAEPLFEAKYFRFVPGGFNYASVDGKISLEASGKYSLRGFLRFNSKLNLAWFGSKLIEVSENPARCIISTP